MCGDDEQSIREKKIVTIEGRFYVKKVIKQVAGYYTDYR